MFSVSNRTFLSNVRDFADGVVVDVEGPALPCAEAWGVVWGGSAHNPCAEALASDLGRGTDIGAFPPLEPVVVGRLSKPAFGRGVLNANIYNILVNFKFTLRLLKLTLTVISQY